MEASAVEALTLAVKRAPDFAEGHHALGLALARGGRPHEALEHLAAAVRLAPDSARYRAVLEALQRQDGGGEAGLRAPANQWFGFAQTT